ncbi:MAG: guanylate kinase [Defluviitaleaceae bacterium]|nr:guanylate kinase [Defluviitaleaceae bacterium]
MPLGTEKGQLLIISGPSGSGKGTVTKKLIPCDNFALSVSMTTRDPRPGEVHGVDYIFCTKENFMEIRDNDGFLEHATFSGNYYGTPISYVESKIDEGQTVVLEIEVVGALQVKKKYPDAILVFLMPPTFADLRQRLIERGTECEDEIERRTRRAREEMVELEKYDYLVVNDDIEQAMQDIHMVVKAEKMKPHRNQCKIETFYGDNMEGDEI